MASFKSQNFFCGNFRNSAFPSSHFLLHDTYISCWGHCQSTQVGLGQKRSLAPHNFKPKQQHITSLNRFCTKLTVPRQPPWATYNWLQHCLAHSDSHWVISDPHVCLFSCKQSAILWVSLCFWWPSQLSLPLFSLFIVYVCGKSNIWYCFMN